VERNNIRQRRKYQIQDCGWMEKMIK
jgi:hypothetical protein